MKKLMIALAVGAFLLSMTGISSATDVNIYGASAQFNFWSNLATTWLTLPVASGGAHCQTAPVTNAGASYSPADKTPAGVYYHGAKYFVVTASQCDASVATDQKITIRVSAYDSEDGINAVLGTTNLNDVYGCTKRQRMMLNDNTNNADTNFGCYDVHLGASDVNGTTLIQSTQGQLDGPKGPTSVTVGDVLLAGGVAGGALPAPDLGKWTAGAAGSDYPVVAQATCSNGTLIDNHPFVDPFAFYVENDAKTAGDGLLAANITNLTQGMVEQIFSGNVTDWHTFFPSIPAGSTITRCLRVAGSGTYATFDAGVMKTNGVGATLPSKDETYPPVSDHVWFNNTSGDMENCFSTIPGAIGFIDASTGAYAGATQVSFNGTAPTGANLQNGTYDRFWSLEHIFEPIFPLPANTGTFSDAENVAAGYANNYPSPTVSAMMNWANNLTAWPAGLPAAYQTYWAIDTLMSVHKGTDFTYPPIAGAYVTGTCYE
jgi:ABC-type phosphate transport system substrate-binding protein